ncbi:LCP family protein [Pseudonocardia hispaniensis]|uniref:LCP family protein n=1 Tax=Pseudonocardia hispaniensis TaxID=904933 RepID=A0ABW1J740_9PSEU
MPADRATRATAPPPARREPPATGGRSPRGRGLGTALGITAAATVAPGSGHLLLRRRRTGGLLLGTYLLAVSMIIVTAGTIGRARLLETVLSTKVLGAVMLVSLAAAVGWISVVIRTWILARPERLTVGRKVLGTAVVAMLCLVVAVPFGFAATLANSQRNLLNALFPGRGGTSAAEALNKPRLNVLLLGSDAGPDREGTRTDTMMVASIDTRTAKTILFSLPRNIQRAQFPPESAMAERFPRGFHDPRAPLSGDYLLNAVYGYAHANPDVAPAGPTDDPGINLLSSTVSYMLGLPLDFYLEVDMAGFAAIIDALGGVTIDVGPTPLPIGGVLPDGRHVKPDGYIQPGLHTLDGEAALWFARSRRNSDDYDRMGRQRCLLQAILDQKSPTVLLTNFQDVAAAATANIRTNIPQAVLPKLVSLADDAQINLQSVAFDPSLPDPSEPDGRFNTARPEVGFMRAVVSAAIDGRPLAAPATASATPTRSPSRSAATAPPTSAPVQPPSAGPVPVADSCASGTR